MSWPSAPPALLAARDFETRAGRPRSGTSLLADYLPYCETVRMPNRAPATPACRDPFDTPFLELILAGKVDFLVSGNRDLLNLANTFTCPIVSAEVFPDSHL